MCIFSTQLRAQESRITIHNLHYSNASLHLRSEFQRNLLREAIRCQSPEEHSLLALWQ